MLIGNIDYGTWKNGESIFKDKKGYYIIKYDIKKKLEYKFYLKNYRPKKNADLLYFDKKTKKWKLIKKSSKKSSKK